MSPLLQSAINGMQGTSGERNRAGMVLMGVLFLKESHKNWTLVTGKPDHADTKGTWHPSQRLGKVFRVRSQLSLHSEVGSETWVCHAALGPPASFS